MWFIVCQITFRVLEQFDLTDQYNVTAWLITAKIYSYPWPFERKRYTRKTSLKLYSHYLVCSFKTDQTEILKYFGTLYAALLHSVITQRLSRQYRKQKTYGFQYGTLDVAACQKDLEILNPQFQEQNFIYYYYYTQSTFQQKRWINSQNNKYI